MKWTITESNILVSEGTLLENQNAIVDGDLIIFLNFLQNRVLFVCFHTTC